MDRETLHLSQRIIPDADECDAVFTLRRQPGMSDDEFARDAKAVPDDLARLKDRGGTRGCVARCHFRPMPVVPVRLLVMTPL